MENLIENFRLDRRHVAVGAASRRYSDSFRSLMDKSRRLFQSSQAPDFRVGDLLHVQIWQYCSYPFVLHDEQLQGCGVHGPSSQVWGPPTLQGCKGSKPQISSLSQGVFQKPRLFWGGGLATGSSSPEPIQKPSLEIIETK